MTDLTSLIQHNASIKPMHTFLEIHTKLRGAASVPDFETMLLQDELLPLLRDVSVMERVGDGHPRYRFLGSGIVERVGADLTGEAVTKFMPPESHDLYTQTIDAICDTPAGLYGRMCNRFSSGYEAHNEMLALPVCDKENNDARVVIAIACIKEIRQSHQAAEDLMIGVEWTASKFIDIGFGVPNWTEESTQSRVPAS